MYLHDNITKCLNQYVRCTHTLRVCVCVFVVPFNYALASHMRSDNSIAKKCCLHCGANQKLCTKSNVKSTLGKKQLKDRNSARTASEKQHLGWNISNISFKWAKRARERERESWATTAKMNYISITVTAANPKCLSVELSLFSPLSLSLSPLLSVSLYCV